MARPALPGAHQALLDAARVEFARVGPAAARVEDIARRAGVSKGAFYLHFRTKDDAFLQLVQRLIGALEALAERREEATRRLWAAPPAGPAEVEARFEAEIALDVEHLELLWRHRHLIPAVDGAAGTRGGALMEGFKQRLRVATVARVRARQADGQLRADVSAGVAADLILGSSQDLGRRMATFREKPDLAAWARDLRLIVSQGLLTRRSAIPPRRPRPTRAPRPPPRRA